MKNQKKKGAVAPLRGADVHALDALTQRTTRAVDGIHQKLADDVAAIASTTQFQSVKRGNITEKVIEATFNADAVQKGSSLRATAGQGNGFACHTSIDLKVTDGAKVVKTAQVKSSQNAEVTGLRLGKPAYQDVDALIAPEGQVGAAKEALARSSARNKASQVPRRQELGEVQEKAIPKVDDRLRHGDVQSEAVSVSKADRLASGDRTDLTRARQSARVRNRVKGAAKGGAAIGAAVGVCRHGAAWHRGEETLLEAAAGTVKDTVVSTGVSVASAVAQEMVERGIERAAVRLVGRSVRGAGPAAAVVSCTVNLVRLARDGELTVKNVAGEAGTAALAWGGAEVGMLCGAPLGPVGIAAGGLIGSVVAVGAVEPVKKLWRWAFH